MTPMGSCLRETPPPSWVLGEAGGLLWATQLLCRCWGSVCSNCPISSLLISFELFGFSGMPYYLLTVAVSYMLSGYYGLYHAQKIMYSKTETHFINTVTH